MRTILVVDDDKTFTGLLKTIFEMEGYATLIAHRPEDVLPMARETKPTVVLMDVHTGRGDTFAVLQELRAEEALQDVIVVMDSGMDHTTECLSRGADAFILKPFRPSELLDVITGLVDNEEQA